MRFSTGLIGLPATALGPGVAWLIPRPGVVDGICRPLAFGVVVCSLVSQLWSVF